MSQMVEISQSSLIFSALTTERLLLHELGFWKGRYQDVYMYALLNHGTR